MKDHELVPVAGCQEPPPSVEYSTPATTPPPVSEAVPVTVTRVPFGWVDPAAGVAMLTVGPVVSVDLVVATRPDIKVVGWALMSANRLTSACCMRGSAGAES